MCCMLGHVLVDERPHKALSENSRFQLVYHRFEQTMDGLVPAFIFVGIFAFAGASVRVGILKILQIAGWDV